MNENKKFFLNDLKVPSTEKSIARLSFATLKQKPQNNALKEVKSILLRSGDFHNQIMKSINDSLMDAMKESKRITTELSLLSEEEKQEIHDNIVKALMERGMEMSEQDEQEQKVEKTSEELRAEVTSLLIRTKCHQASIEGLSRQIWQAATQQSIIGNFDTYSAMLSELKTQFWYLNACMEEYKVLEKKLKEVSEELN